MATSAAPAAFALLLVGCTSAVVPPKDPEQTVVVYLLREAMHIGLVLPAAPGKGFVEYGFGDWRWYALGRDSWYHVFRTVLWPTQGALCRREFAAGDEGGLRRQAWFAELAPLPAPAAAVADLRAQLEAAFARGQGEQVERRELRMQFVPDAQDYWLFWTCADVVADWLRSLGCSVGFAPIRASLRVAGT